MNAASTAPVVSVIMPTYKRPALLRRSIESVLAQTYRNLELIVVDDCSPDDTAQVVGEFAGDERVRYFRREQNGRAAAARNDGLRLARGSLIAFQDDDDMWLPQKLERQVAELLKQPADVGLLVCSYIRRTPHRDVFIGGPQLFASLDFGEGDPGGIRYDLIATPSWLLKREYAERAGEFDTRMRSWDDWELGLRLWRICRFVHLDEALYIQDHVLGSAMMGNDLGRVTDLRIIREKHADLWERRPDVRATHHFFIGRRECFYGDMTAGRAELIAALKARPWRPRPLLALLLSLLGRGGIMFAMRVLHVIKYPRAYRNLFRRPSEPSSQRPLDAK